MYVRTIFLHTHVAIFLKKKLKILALTKIIAMNPVKEDIFSFIHLGLDMQGLSLVNDCINHFALVLTFYEIFISNTQTHR